MKKKRKEKNQRGCHIITVHFICEQKGDLFAAIVEYQTIKTTFYLEVKIYEYEKIIS